jgi:sulfide:quinone oxidoreductase
MIDIRTLTPAVSVAAQITALDVRGLAEAGFKSLICNRPDGEGADQPLYLEIERRAVEQGLQIRYLPVESGRVTDDQGQAFRVLLDELPQPVLAYCRTGTRSATLWAMAEAGRSSPQDILTRGQAAGYDLQGIVQRLMQSGAWAVAPATAPVTTAPIASTAATASATAGPAPEGFPAIGEVVVASHQVIIVGGGAAGISVAASLLARQPKLDVAIIDPADVHYYQPGWTLVGGGVFQPEQTRRPMGTLIPNGVKWIKAAVAGFEPEKRQVILDGCRVVRYEQLVVCPGLKLDWGAIEGLSDTLGRNGVTSNYRFDLAPYTWKLVQDLKGGRAVFTQPPMPIKCAGAPQKAMYLSADEWRRQGSLKNIQIDFCSAGVVLFGVADYVPALMEYVETYGIHLNFGHTLTAINGSTREATFTKALADGTKESVVKPFDMIHVVPPQKAPDFIRASSLADAAGWVDLDLATLRHKTLPHIYGLGDAGNTTNAKTAAAARKQAPVVAHNVLVERGLAKKDAIYDGYGSCPLTVERGKIVLAEFLYGGKVAPSFPEWLINGKRPSRLAWLLKERILPPVYWYGMLQGREWMVEPELRD